MKSISRELKLLVAGGFAVMVTSSTVWLTSYLVPKTIDKGLEVETKHMTAIAKNLVESGAPTPVASIAAAGHGLVATVFEKKDGDFVRVDTTVLKEDGTKAVGTVLDKNSEAYTHLIAKQPYSGEAQLFNRAHVVAYAPVKTPTFDGAVFVGIDKQAADESRDTAATLTWIATGVAGASCLGFFTFVALMLNKIFKSRMEVLQESVESLSSGRGDLTARVKVNREDELGHIAIAVNKFIDVLYTLINQMKTEALEVEDVSAKLSKIVSATTGSVEQQNDRVAQSAASIEQLSVSISMVADKSAHTKQQAADAFITVLDGKKCVSELRNLESNLEERMSTVKSVAGDFVSSVDKIVELSSTVMNVAKQTNLLALNAAIEAARAGDNGRGFAVVADEVRELSNHSAKVAQEIQAVTDELGLQSTKVLKTIDESAEALNRCLINTKSVGEALDSIDNITSSVKQTAEDIADSVTEQVTATQQIAQAMETLSTTSEQTEAQMQEAQRLSIQLDRTASKMDQSLKQFKV